jgi:protein-S-isoprenylcysteine O-methyltransferase Ste14
VLRGNGTLAPWDPPRNLVTAGPYGYCRNPMKIGLFLVLLAEALLFRSAPLLYWFVCFTIANLIYVPCFEERGLMRRFGRSYNDYCARVPRWLPRLGAQRCEQTRSERA